MSPVIRARNRTRTYIFPVQPCANSALEPGISYPIERSEETQRTMGEQKPKPSEAEAKGDRILKRLLDMPPKPFTPKKLPPLATVIGAPPGFEWRLADKDPPYDSMGTVLEMGPQGPLPPVSRDRGR